LEPINVFDYEHLAKARMEPSAWDYYYSGSDDEVTLRANRTAFECIELRPRVLMDVSTCDTRTTVLDTAISMPILVAPTAFHSLAHCAGECATAQATGRSGTLMVVSSLQLEVLRTLQERQGVHSGSNFMSMTAKVRKNLSIEP
jgi:isopentenyl diphosphate isomerase/L-lactate dehydrogenase-like FMN-dependent dehydrogenase